MGKPGSWIAAFAALLLLTPRPASAWDAGGHMLVGEIAARRLNPGVAQKVDALLPLIGTEFNDGQPYNLTTVGAWMDDLRGLGKDFPWGKWHYIDLPCDIPADPHREPPAAPGGDALSAMKAAAALLRTPGASPKARAEAVAQIIHIVGDIHQPLHAATREDRGGNDYLLLPPVPPDPDAPPSRKPFNLHRFWDGAYRYGVSGGRIVELWAIPPIHARPSGPGARPNVIAQQADALLAKYPAPPVGPLEKLALWHWICDSHSVACQHAWPPGPSPQSYEAGRLTPEFVQASHEIAEKQILLAGFRLAALLNTLFADTPAAP